MRTWMSFALPAVALLAGCSAPMKGGAGLAAPAADAPAWTTRAMDEGGEATTIGHVALWYIPNRISDVLDIVRARLRLGPGLAVGARATEFADFYLGAYTSVFVGIPGPRGERRFNWPVGTETNSGAEISVADATASAGVNYGWLEVGLGGQLAIIGVDLGVDVLEAVDFVTGLICIDIIHDDI